MRVKRDGFAADDAQGLVTETFQDLMQGIFLPVPMTFVIDFGLIPAVRDEEVFIESSSVWGGEDESSPRFQATLYSFEKFFEGGWVKVLKDLSEEDGVKVIFWKGKAGLIIKIVIEQLYPCVIDDREPVWFKVDGANIPPIPFDI